MDDEKPITDKENFPPPDSKAEMRMLVDMSQLAYIDGVKDGYRKAVQDFLLWAFLFFAVSMMVQSFAAD